MKRNLAALILLLVVSICDSHDELSEQVKALTLRIRSNPDNAQLYFQRAELYRADGHWKDAELDYKKARQLSADLAATDLGLGLVYLSTNQFTQSRDALQRFLSHRPDHAEALVALGNALAHLGQLNDAITSYSKALRLRPDPEVFIKRSRLLAEEKKIDQAIAGLDEGISELGSVVTLELFAVELEVQMKRYGQALKRIDRIAGQADRKETWHAKRGEILTQAGRYNDAREAYQFALEAINKLSNARRNNRYTKELENKIRAALSELETKIQ